MGGVSEWWPWEGDTGISTEHFLYNENNLTKCSTQRNSPPIPHTPPPLLHRHYITISKPRVQSKSSLSRIGARHSEGGGRGQDWGSKTRPKTVSFYPGSMCAYVHEAEWIWEHGSTSACLLVRESYRKSVEILLIGSSTSCTEEKSIHIPEAHNGACRGSDGVAEKCQSRYTVQLRGHCMADGQHRTGKVRDLYISWSAQTPHAWAYC